MDWGIRLRHTVRLLLLAGITTAGVTGFLWGCGESKKETDKSDPNATRPKTLLNIIADQEWIFVIEGDSVSVGVDTVTNNTWGRTLPRSIQYKIEPIADRYNETTWADNLSADYSWAPDTSPGASSRAALLTIATRAPSEPGVYLHEITFEEENPPFGFEENKAARLGLVVVPTGGAVKTGKVTKMAAGLGHSLALLEDGTVWAWGDNQFGQLGDGTLIDRNVPVPVQGFDGPVRSIAAGDNHSMALQENGRVYTWGANDEGQIGVSIDWITTPGCPQGRYESDHREESFSIAKPAIMSMVTPGSDACAYTPTFLEDIFDIAGGDSHSLALEAGGQVYSWGNDNHGQLARNSETIRPFARPVQDLPATPMAISAGTEFSLALLDDGTVWGWGRNHSFQLGYYSVHDHPRPVEIPFVPPVQLISAGADYTVVMVQGESGFTGWGANSSGQLGRGATPEPTWEPQQTATHLSLAGLAAGQMHVVAAMVDGQVWAWGDNGFGQMAGASSEAEQTFPVLIPDISPPAGWVGSVAAGGRHSLAREIDCDTVWAWGGNYYGQLGHSSVEHVQETPLQVYGLGEAGLATGCRAVLHVFQQEGSRVISDPIGFEAPGCEGVCAAEFTAHSVVTLTAEPLEGFEFSGWRGDCTGNSETILVTMDESKNCFADVSPAGPPEPIFTYSPSAPEAGETIAFEAGEITTPTIIGYLWDFGDGTPPKHEDTRDTTHTYATAGLYTVSLKVTAENGLTNTTTEMIEVTDSQATTHVLTVIVQGNGTVETDDGGINCEPDCTETYPAGTDVTVFVNFGPGAAFINWGDDCAPFFIQTNFILTMDSDKSCLAMIE